MVHALVPRRKSARRAAAARPQFRGPESTRAHQSHDRSHALPRTRAKLGSSFAIMVFLFPTRRGILGDKPQHVYRFASPRASCGARRRLPRTSSLDSGRYLERSDPSFDNSGERRGERLAALPRLPSDEGARVAERAAQALALASTFRGRPFQLEGMGGALAESGTPPTVVSPTWLHIRPLDAALEISSRRRG